MSRRLRPLMVAHVLGAAGAVLWLLVGTRDATWLLPWWVVLPVLVGLVAVANRTTMVPGRRGGDRLLYTPTTPFQLAGAVLLPPLGVAVLALAATEHGSRFGWFNRLRRVLALSLAALAYWQVHGPGSQQVTAATAGRDALALLAAMAVFELVNAVVLGGSVWLVQGVPPTKQEQFRQVEHLTADLWELSAAAAGAALALTAPVLLVPASGLLVLVLRQSAFVQAVHERDRDVKTGLLNMRSFTRLAERELSRARRHDRPLSILMLDLDDLRRVNAVHGHLGGDHAIQLIARILNEQLRAEDLPARFGGEEFVVVLPDTGIADALGAAERIRSAVEAATEALPTGELRVTVSGGLAGLAWNETLEDLLVNADRALYEAKDAGRNQISVAPLPAVTGD